LVGVVILRLSAVFQAKQQEAASISAEFKRTVNDRVNMVQDGFAAYVHGE
jgi:hypothetical protein